jgi:hypothetical protein
MADFLTGRNPTFALAGTGSAYCAFTEQSNRGFPMGEQIKHVTLSTLACAPVIAGMGFVLVTGLIAN